MEGIKENNNTEQIEEDIKQAEMDRVKDCTMALKGVLAQYNCGLDASVTLRHNQIIPDIRVVPLKSA